MPEEIGRTAFQLEPRPGETLRGDLWAPAPRGDPGRAVVVCHGFKGFKDWGFFPYVARRLASHLGCRVVSFNFTGSGVGADLENFTEPEAFGRNTFSKELADATAVVEGLETGRLGDLEFDPASRIGILGHSRGAVAAILSGERATVRAVVTWAGIGSVERYASLFENVPAGHPVPIRNARTGDVIQLYPDVLEDIRAHPERFDLGASLRMSGVPLLVVHGTEDGSVPPSDGRRLAAASPTARFEPIEGAGHTFEAKHPFDGPTPELDRALGSSVDHFREHLF